MIYLYNQRLYYGFIKSTIILRNENCHIISKTDLKKINISTKILLQLYDLEKT